MTTTLTPEIRKALEEAGEQPLEIVDAGTSQRYMLLKASAFDRLHALLQGDPLTKDEQRFLLQQAGRRASWNDPEMDVYDDLVPARPRGMTPS